MKINAQIDTTRVIISISVLIGNLHKSGSSAVVDIIQPRHLKENTHLTTSVYRIATMASQNDTKSRIGLWGLAVMGQNFALNIASKGFSISVTNRSEPKVTATVERAKKEKLDDKLRGFFDKKAFINSLSKPRNVIILVKAGKPVDDTISQLLELMEPGDMIIDGGTQSLTCTSLHSQYAYVYR